jgi:predicted alpha/beta hydrolase
MTDELHLQLISVKTSDGHFFEGRVHGAEESGPVLIMFPAMGVRATVYDALATTFMELGHTVVVFDLRGHGTSSLRASRAVNFGYREMTELDFPAAVLAVKSRFPDRLMLLFGHSLGGQMSLLSASRDASGVDGIVLVATSSVFYKIYDDRWILRFWQALVGPVVRLVGHYPGDKLGFAHREAAQVMKDWARQGRTGRYVLKGSTEDYEGLLALLPLPILAIAFDGDRLAPALAVDHLVGKARAAPVSRVDLRLPDGQRSAHFRWIDDSAAVVATVVEWIAKELA